MLGPEETAICIFWRTIFDSYIFEAYVSVMTIIGTGSPVSIAVMGEDGPFKHSCGYFEKLSLQTADMFV